MNWYTICGYEAMDGQDIVVKVQANSEEQAWERVQKDERFTEMEKQYLFLGKLDELTGNPECFEMPL